MAVDDGDLSVVDVDEILRVFDDRRGVRREEIFALADADDHRAALTCGDDLVAVALLDDGDGIGTDHLLEACCTASSSVQPFVVRTYSIRLTSTSESVLLRNV